MLSLLKNRLQQNDYKILLENGDLLNIMCYACFGVPRALLNMIQDIYAETPDELANNYNRSNVFNAIRNCLMQTKGIYESLQQKLPMYSKFIEKGNEIFNYVVELIKEYNKNKDELHQAVTIAIRRPIPSELTKVFGFYQYAGLFMPKGELNKGEKGVFDLYLVHYAALIERNAFMSETRIAIHRLAKALATRNAHEYKRVTPKSLIKSNNLQDDFSLSLPNCPACGAARVSENAKFCLECGTQLRIASIYYDLINNDISVLPLTEKRIRSIKENSTIKTVKDILLDNGNIELRGVPRIGPYWAKKILSYAEEYLV